MLRVVGLPLTPTIPPPMRVPWPAGGTLLAPPTSTPTSRGPALAHACRRFLSLLALALPLHHRAPHAIVLNGRPNPTWLGFFGRRPHPQPPRQRRIAGSHGATDATKPALLRPRRF